MMTHLHALFKAIKLQRWNQPNLQKISQQRQKYFSKWDVFVKDILFEFAIYSKILYPFSGSKISNYSGKEDPQKNGLTIFSLVES